MEDLDGLDDTQHVYSNLDINDEDARCLPACNIINTGGAAMIIFGIDPEQQ